MNESPRPWLVGLLTLLAGSVLFLPFLGSVSLFDWDEINFAEAAREMIVTGDYLNVQINFRPFWEKPPLFFWLQVISMKMFGINEFAARFPNAICGMLTLIVLYQMGKKLFDHRMGIIWMLAYAGSLLPFFYFKSGIIDPWFNVFIFLGIYFGACYLLQDTKRSLHALFTGSFIGLAVLTKGPVALLLFGLTALIYLIITRFRISIRFMHIVLFLAGLVFFGGFWFLIQFLTGHGDVVGDFFQYQVRLFKTRDAGHGGFPLYHFLVLFFGVFPASLFAMNGLTESKQETPFRRGWSQICLILLVVVLVVFTIVRTKIIHYSSLAYFPLTFLASQSIYQVITGKNVMNRLVRVSLGITGAIWALAVIGMVMVFMNKESVLSSGMIRDAFAAGNLQAHVSWSGWELLISLPLILSLILFYIIHDPWKRMIVIFAGTMLFSFLTMAVIMPRAEGYTQRAAIEFYREKSQEDCYIHTLGFKSYAHLFYGEKKPPVNPLSYDQQWLLKGQIDKPVYVVYKITRKERYREEYPKLRILYEKNGYVFARRDLPVNPVQ